MVEQTIKIPWKRFSEQVPDFDKPILFKCLEDDRKEYYRRGYLSSAELGVIIPGNNETIMIEKEQAHLFLWAYPEEVFSIMGVEPPVGSAYPMDFYISNVAGMLSKILKNLEDRYGKMTPEQKRTIAGIQILR